MLFFEEEPALGLFPLMLFVRTLDDIVENRAEVGLYFEPLGVLACEASALVGRFDDKCELALHLILHFSFHASAFSCPLLSLAVTRPE